MKNYKVQNGCHNCRYCFILTEYDMNDEYYCTKDAPPRPKSGSSHLDENFDEFKDAAIHEKERIEQRELTIEELCKINLETYIQHDDIWRSWGKERKVSHSGICDNWEEVVATF